MKKSYLMMAAAATMLAACTQTDLVQEVNTQQAIGFEAFAGKTTRAEITNEGDLQKTGVGFKVWGYTGNTTNDVVFNGDNVEWNGSAWSYDDLDTDLKYWDAQKTYSFYAVAPISDKAAWDNTNAKYTITNAVSGKSTLVTDYLTATPKTDIDGSKGQQVNFEFNHVMSKVSVVLATTAQNVSIHSVEMTGWNSGNGAYNSSATSTWSIETAGNEAADIYDAGTTSTTIDGETTTTDNFNAIDNVVTSSYLIVPQTISGKLKFTLTYKVGNVLFTNNSVEIENQVWDVNEHTTYTINIGVGPITFGVSSVNGWKDISETVSVQ